MRAKNDKHIKEMLLTGMYRATEDGRIETLISPYGHLLDGWREKSVMVDVCGYCYTGYKRKKLFVHRIVYEYFKKDLDIKMQVNHIDGNPRNNAISNLEQLNANMNIKHSYDHLGRKANYGNASIDFELAEEVRRVHKDGWSYGRIIREFGLAKSTISYIINYKTWRPPNE